MLGQRLRRWPNIEPEMPKNLVFAGMEVTLKCVNRARDSQTDSKWWWSATCFCQVAYIYQVDVQVVVKMEHLYIFRWFTGN